MPAIRAESSPLGIGLARGQSTGVDVPDQRPPRTADDMRGLVERHAVEQLAVGDDYRWWHQTGVEFEASS
ncbi:MAG: hypothetical protein WKF82_12520 [Nocardioidaceae bacterium]